MAYKRTTVDSPNRFINQYLNKGDGRDTYISFDNGGFNTLYSPAKAPDQGTTYFRSQKSSIQNLAQSSSPS